MGSEAAHSHTAPAQSRVSTATETREQAVEPARSAVQGRLAAGAQIIGPVVSAFWHDGEFGTGEERQLLLKTRQSRYAGLEARKLVQYPPRVRRRTRRCRPECRAR
ncbi:divalent cation tolerance protein CutA [Streptomyces sp. NPDC007901]|uniref:divalent cation tolerance protein CutA n=1 Tax=Streptomyces sp. NPDC007901 TaxID=3364785 RepID=UPI0036E7F154